jgi:hypothetical protein
LAANEVGIFITLAHFAGGRRRADVQRRSRRRPRLGVERRHWYGADVVERRGCFPDWRGALHTKNLRTGKAAHHLAEVLIVDQARRRAIGAICLYRHGKAAILEPLGVSIYSISRWRKTAKP